MLAQYELWQCPNCRSTGEVRVGIFCTGLGRSLTECRRCGTVYPAGRIEWCQYGLVGQVWYVALSTAYCLGIGLIGGLSTQGMFHFLAHGPWDGSMPIHNPTFLAGALLFAGVVAGLQVGRVVASIRRSRRIAARAAMPSGDQPLGELDRRDVVS